jgi:uncharacterized protein (DUF58 family)
VRREARAAAAPYRLALPTVPSRGTSGERLGRGTGSSLEFQDFRGYVPGDDPRHVDWRAYARTDELQVRLFREEVAPTLDVVADLSASMATTPAKEDALRDLLEAATCWMAGTGGTCRLLASGGDRFEDADAAPVGATPPGDLLPRTALRPRGLRMLVSDFLFPDDPGPAIRRLAHGAAYVYVLQLLDPWEAAPSRDGPLTLVDAEGPDRLDLVLDAAAVERYRTRLATLRDAVSRATRAAGGTYATVVAAPPAAMFREHLLAQRVLEPA